MAPPDTQTQNTPLAPSVEKAYYRKCIQLKRRLNEVEAANDEAKVRRVRLERAVMKMRLERAFLLDELRKRMDENIDASEGSGDEGMATPPPERPHRDKRRRQQQSTTGEAADDAPTSTKQEHSEAAANQQDDQTQAEVDLAQSPGRDADGAGDDEDAPAGEQRGRRSSADGMDLDGANDDGDGEDRGAGTPLSAGPSNSKGANGERRLASPSSAAENAAEMDEQDDAGQDAGDE